MRIECEFSFSEGDGIHVQAIRNLHGIIAMNDVDYKTIRNCSTNWRRLKCTLKTAVVAMEGINRFDDLMI